LFGVRVSIHFMNKGVIVLVVVGVVAAGYWVMSAKSPSEESSVVKDDVTRTKNTSSEKAASNSQPATQKPAAKASLPTCTISAEPVSSEWKVGLNTYVTLAWRSTDATSAWLWFHSGGMGGDIVDVVKSKGTVEKVYGTKSLMINRADSSPMSYVLVVEGKSGIAVCNTNGETQTKLK